MKKSEFDYSLPDELIAKYPAGRGESRLFVLDRENGGYEHRKFSEITEYFNRGDCLVINDTRVIPARFKGCRRSTGGKLEVLLVEKLDDKKWKAIVSPVKKGRKGDKLILEEKLSCEVVEIIEETGERIIHFKNNDDILKFGSIPIPPYINREVEGIDRIKYQTVYADKDGAVAAPTAGLHFSIEILKALEEKGVEIVNITLHVGPGTFRPVRVNDISEHKMEEERFEIPEKSAEKINKIHSTGGDIFVVGTTTVRALETMADDDGKLNNGKGRTELFIYPPYDFKIVDHLITNFHLPGSTLLMLVSAFASRKLILKAYDVAVREKYRFYSYGDAMLII